MSMEQDEFNDFEQGTEPQNPQPVEAQQPDLNQHASIPGGLDTPETVSPVPSLHPSFSVMTNVESQPTFDFDKNEWERAPYNNLTKTESQHGADVEAMSFEFNKRNSQREDSDEVNENTGGLKEEENGTELQKPVSDRATIHTQQLQDLNFDLLKPQQPTNTPEQVKTVKSDNILFFESNQTYQSSQFKTQDLDQPLIVQEKDEQLRKESEQFDEFTSGQQVQEVPIHVETVENNNNQQISQKVQQHIDLIDNGLVSEQKVQIIVETGVEPLQQSVPQQQNQITQKVEPEDEDQFGDFEQTVQAQPQRSLPVNHEVYQRNGVEDNKVRVDQTKAPFGIETDTKQKYLQEFVDSLPDYSFLLAKAFNSL